MKLNKMHHKGSTALEGLVMNYKVGGGGMLKLAYRDHKPRPQLT